jgi:hypothetical protein
VYALEATREVAEGFGDGVVGVEAVHLNEAAGRARYRDLRRGAGEHLPVPCVLLDGRLVSPNIPDQEDLREIIAAALASAP